MQRPTQPVTPNLSYDELVVAEANRRIRAEEHREIALAEKKRLEEDVAELIALQKNPHHVTRAMVADAARKKVRLEKLAAEEHQAKVDKNTLLTTKQILMLFEQKELEIKADAEAKAKAEADSMAKARAEVHERYEAERTRRKLHPTPDEQWEDKFQEYVATIQQRNRARRNIGSFRDKHIYDTRSKESQKLRSDIRRLAQEGKTHIEIADQVSVKPKDIINFFTLLANNNL
jgi:hypothetical protein